MEYIIKIVFALIINLILTLFVELFLLLDDSTPIKEWGKQLKRDFKYLIFIFMIFNFGYLIQNIFNIR